MRLGATALTPVTGDGSIIAKNRVKLFDHYLCHRTRHFKKLHFTRAVHQTGQPLFRGGYSPTCTICALAMNQAVHPQHRFATHTEQVARTHDSEQTMSFTDGTPSGLTTIQTSIDPTARIGNYGNSDLGQFMSRPVRIHTFDWSIGSSFDFELDPWTLFFSDAQVLARLNNYALLRCTLKVKILLNSTPFHYGLGQMSYAPWEDYDQTSDGARTLTIVSQRPKVFLNPSTNEGAEMSLPFFHVENYIDVTTDVGFSEMGRCAFNSYGTLRHSNGGTGDISMTVMAWAEDVELCVPTTSGAMVAAQVLNAGFSAPTVVNQASEYQGNGVISTPATAVANAAGMLTSVPGIAPFAMATQLGASAIASIAKIFGFSRPAILEKTLFYKPKFCSSLAATDLPETVCKLTYDSKQEITIDPRTVGLVDKDEMSILSIAQRESFLATFDWDPTNSVDRLLFSSQVAPMLEPIVLGGTFFDPTAMSFASWPFKFWAGSIKFRFKFITSGFHHGRVRISYIPTGKAQNTNTAFNTVYTEVVDIGDNSDFSMTINWADPDVYKKVHWDMAGTHHVSGTTGQALEVDKVYDNGVITVRVLSALTAPSSNASIECNVFVSAGDDFELCEPVDDALEVMSYNSVSNQMAEGDDSTVTASDSIPVTEAGAYGQADTNHLFGHHSSVSDMKSQVFFGEKVVSFRTLLRRYNKYTSHMYGVASDHTTDTTFADRLNVPSYPIQRGFSLQSPHSTFAEHNVMYAHMTLLQYLAPAYVGYRGSLRSKFRDMSARVEHITASRGSRDSGTTRVPLMVPRVVGNVNGNPSTAAFSNESAGNALLSGGLAHPSKVQPILEVEWPFMSGKRFAFARGIHQSLGWTRDRSDENRKVIDVVYNSIADTAVNGVLEEFIAVGEDFTLFFFLNAPRRAIYIPPLPSATAGE